MCLTKIAGMCIAAQLTAGGTYNTPQMGYNETLYNPSTQKEIKIDTRHLYKDEQTNFYLNGSVYIGDTTRINLGYNSGIDTQKFDVGQTYSIGIDKLFNITKNTDIILSAATKIGGDVRHTVCTDSTNAEFNCMNPLSPNNAREELASITPDNDQHYNAGIKLRYSF